NKIHKSIKFQKLVPSRKTRTVHLDRTKFAPTRRISEIAYSEASNGHVWDALTLNGLALSSILGEDPRPALSAIEAGAFGAGLSRSGSAVAGSGGGDRHEGGRRVARRSGETHHGA